MEPMVRYQAGAATLIASAHGVALVSAAPQSPTCAAIEHALMAGSSFDELAGALSALGFAALPPFAVVINDDGSARFLQRGMVEVTVVPEDGSPITHGPPSVSTWREDAVPVCRQVRLTALGVPKGEEFWLGGAGSAPCSTVTWSAVQREQGTPSVRTDASADGVPADVGPSEVSPAAAVELHVADVPAVAESEVAESEVAQSEVAQSAVAEPESPTPDAGEPEVAEGASDSTLMMPSAPESESPRAVSAPPVSAAHSEVADLDFSHLMDHTLYRHVEDAAVRVDGPPTGQHAATPATPPTGSGHHQIEQGQKSGVVTAVPDMTAAVPAGTAPPASPLDDDDPDHDGHTVARRRTPKPASAPASAATSAMVMAVRCVAGHSNPTNAAQCRVCSQPITDRTPVATPRTTLGVLRFSTGEQVPIDGPVVIGRIPAVSEVDGEKAVQVAIDNSELSRTHATVHVADWFVYVADNGSTNGTRVIVPGSTPETCRLQERIQITPGTVVDLGGVVTFRFDVS